MGTSREGKSSKTSVCNIRGESYLPKIKDGQLSLDISGAPQFVTLAGFEPAPNAGRHRAGDEVIGPGIPPGIERGFLTFAASAMSISRFVVVPASTRVESNSDAPTFVAQLQACRSVPKGG